eukprot:scaffold8332_cov73-Isochrysis_galbana.AAC.1
MQELALLPVHESPVAALAFGPSSTLLTASAAAEVLLHSAARATPLAPLARLRTAGGAPVSSLDVLFPAHEGAIGAWAIGLEDQQPPLCPLPHPHSPPGPPSARSAVSQKGRGRRGGRT